MPQLTPPLILYYSLALIIIMIQILTLIEAWRHLIHTRRKYRARPNRYQPLVALTIPCKGLDTTFQRNIESLFQQVYPNYEIFFVLQSKDDPAYNVVAEQIKKHQKNTAEQTPAAHLLIAGPAQSCSQKVHNLLHVCRQLPEKFQALAFIDSDACLKPYFLANLIHPLRIEYVGAATGYRWFVPEDHRLSSFTLSAMNAFFASLMGPHPWNSAWGGAMAITRKVYEQIHLADLWQYSCSDDYTLTRAVKENHLTISFAPACFVPSYERTNWRNLFSFARRQFIITRLYMPFLWLLALFGLGQFVLGFWLGVTVTAVLYCQHSPQANLAMILPLFLMFSSMTKAAIRQMMIFRILPEDRPKLLIPAILDLLFQPILAAFSLLCVLSAALTRQFSWRGIRYKIHKNRHVEILTPDHSNP